MEQLIGRNKEIAELQRCVNSKRSEFVVIYGRRRIGKTFLVTHTFESQLSFMFTGSHKAPKERQLEMFAKAIKQYGNISYPIEFDNWYHAFDTLEHMLASSKKKGKKIIFFDEMPWIDNVGSEFVAAFEDFWNTWASLRDDILLIASGSATSWMVNKLVENQGGLHNRITSSIYLRQFTLFECEQYLRAHGCSWDRYTITQCYMCLGGVPFYYSLLDYKQDLGTNIDSLFFRPKAKLFNEFNELYNVLFTGADKYIEIVRILSAKREGFSRKELSEKIGSNGGGLTRRLENLENCDFIQISPQYGNKKKLSIVRLSDFFTLFYLKHIEGKQKQTEPYWRQKMYSPEINSWQGLSFEQVCLEHINQIKQKLGISGIITTHSSWRCKNPQNNYNPQIDLVIERADRYIHLCEIKFSTTQYSITKEYENKLRERIALFIEDTKTKKTIFTTFITTFGLKQNIHSGIVHSEITMDDLFMPTLN